MRVAPTPLAIPILAGPGTIATAMDFAAAGSLVAVATTVGILALMFVVTYIFFVYGREFIGFLGGGVVRIITSRRG
jgi:multiple antibiotic resistance protein